MYFMAHLIVFRYYNNSDGQLDGKPTKTNNTWMILEILAVFNGYAVNIFIHLSNKTDHHQNIVNNFHNFNIKRINIIINTQK